MNNQPNEDSSNVSGLPTFLAGLLFGGLAGLLLGGLTGAAAMFLLAPRAGKQTRSKLQKQGAKLRHQAAESMEEAVSEAGDKAHEFTDNVQKGVDGLQQRGQEMLTKGKK
jgi:gas vesicle protein